MQVTRGTSIVMTAIVFLHLWNCGTQAVEPRTPLEMAQRVDQLLESRLMELGWQPAGPCDDASFLRRLSLDLSGHAPSANEVHQFLQDLSSDKRARLIEKLLNSPISASHFANVWSEWLLPELDSPATALGRGSLRTWLRDRFAENLRYDRLVADLLVASGTASNGPAAFFVSLEGKPEKIAAKTSRVFLGLQLDCAECHDHPFDHWKQREFWGFAAYFAQISTYQSPMVPGNTSISDTVQGEVHLPNTNEIIAPAALVKTGFSGLASGTRRQQLTLWLTARENPYLARAAVNRAWALLFGRGLIEPIDDMRNLELASHADVLSELSEYFAATGFDLRRLFATLAATKAYHRATVHPRGIPPEGSYALMIVKPLTGTQLATCLSQVARQNTTEQGNMVVARISSELGRLRGEGSQATLGMVQALVTLHSETMSQVWSEMHSRLLAALSAPHLTPQQQLEWIFLSTVNRLPTQAERDQLEELVKPSTSGERTVAIDKQQNSDSAPEPTGNELSKQVASGQAWQADLLWALINSTEFAMTP